jgi:hypothetical protein
MPGIGELPGGTTGRCVPAGNTGAAGGCVLGCGAVGGATGAAVGAVGVPGVVAPAGAGAGGCAAASGSGGPSIVAGGPVNDMLLCVPM